MTLVLKLVGMFKLTTDSYLSLHLKVIVNLLLVGVYIGSRPIKRLHKLRCSNQYSIFTKQLSLGSTLTPNTTLFIQYRVGGGLATNLGTNVINQVGTVSFFVNGPSQTTNTSVINSLRCTNPICLLVEETFQM
jgi:hypothetical protein